MAPPRTLPALSLRFLPETIWSRRRLLLALVALEVIILTGLVAAILAGVGSESEGDEFVARETLLAERDLPAGWIPVSASAYPYLTDSPLLRLLLEDETVAGAFAAYRDPRDASAVATYVAYRPDEPLVLLDDGDNRSLGRVAPLVLELERLARQHADGALPEIVFAASDVPTPEALRGRSLTPPTGEGVQSESVLFTTGPVLALLVMEHPKDEEPFEPIEDLAQIVYSRIQKQLH